MRFLLTDLANGKATLPPGRYNVRMMHDPPLNRQVTSVAWERHRGGRWLFVRWIPEPRDDGGRDCGYSGYSEDHDRLAEFALTPA